MHIGQGPQSMLHEPYPKLWADDDDDDDVELSQSSGCSSHSASRGLRSASLVQALQRFGLPQGETLQPVEPTRRRGRRRKAGTTRIARCLAELEEEEENCIVVVRSVAKLGMQSLEQLHLHLGQFGGVVKVLGSRNHEREPGQGSLRPSGMAFALMADAAGASAVLAYGNEHTVQGGVVKIERFERRPRTGGASGSSL
mmetsp:Transcript_29751/g.68505  ORF Transcript_29751/g.68505 Transcript_29751/m.68505 type:complete len:198 (-) Transcript_29751:214-807(-)